MRYVKEIKLSKDITAFYTETMRTNSRDWPSETLSETAVFDKGYEMDIKLCSADDGGYWTEAVLFKNGSEVCCAEPCDDFSANGSWKTTMFMLSKLSVTILRTKMDLSDSATSDSSKFRNSRNYTLLQRLCSDNSENNREELCFYHAGVAIGLSPHF